MFRWMRYRKAMRKRHERLLKAARARFEAARAKVWEAYINEPDYGTARRLVALLWATANR